MTKIELDPAIKSIQGRIGSLVFRKLPNGETTMIKRADMSNVEWSRAQIENQQRMKQANKYARAAMKNPQVQVVFINRKTYFGKHPMVGSHRVVAIMARKQ